MSERLKASVRESDTVARFGGDEFVILIEGLDISEERAKISINEITDKIIKIINEPYKLDGHDFRTSCSIGICLFIAKELSAAEIIQRADIAMFQVKQSGRNNASYYDETSHPLLEKRARLGSDLRGAVFNEDIVPFYQVQVKDGNKLIGVELLLRWNHPSHGTLMPEEFIPIAEDSNLINSIGINVIEHACQQLKTWEKNSLTQDLRIAVNISARQFNQPEFLSQIETILNEINCRPDLLCFELTENVMLEDINDIIEKMQQLKKMGVYLSLDDFGTGYSSLSILRKFPLDEIKIDRSFVENILNNQHDAELIQTIINMSHNLSIDVIAEGIETKEQETFLVNAGCHFFQGYLYGEPIEMTKFESHIDSMHYY